MNLDEAKELLEENGYILVEDTNEDETEKINIFEKLYDGIYCHWLDCYASYSDLSNAFEHGMEDDIDWEDYRNYLEEEYRGKDIEYIEIAYKDGLDFRQCETDDEINQKLMKKFDF